VKKLFFLLFAGLTCAFPHLNAQIDIEDLGSERPAESKEEPGKPFQIEVSADFVGKAKFRKGDGDHHHLRFWTGLAEISAVYYYDPCHHEALNVALAYERTRLDWRFNPFFNEKNVDTVSLWLGGYTQRLENWIWRGQLSINFDNVAHWDFNDYMNYDLLLWGRYCYCKNFGLHIGFLAQTGMKIDNVYPVIGVDWTYNQNWKINAIFPLNISVVYTINHSWSVDLAARFLDQRHRLKRKEFLSRGLWHYRTTGAEFGINYTPTKWISANIHAGANFGGHLTIANRHYRHRHRLRLDGAPYAGAEIDINF